MDLTGGIKKIMARGAADPDVVRFHVPRHDGGWDQVTWGDVLDNSRKVALYLDDLGVGPGDKVSVYATTRLEWAYCTAGIEACRAVFVPVYFSNTAAQTLYVVDHCDAEVLLTEMALLPKVVENWGDYGNVRQVIVWDLDHLDRLGPLAEAAGVRLTADELAQKVVPFATALHRGEALHRDDPGKLERMVAAQKPEDVAAIIYTSGTTGVPKGAMLSNHNLAVTTAAWNEVLEHALPPAGDRRDILWLPISHMAGWGMLGQGHIYEYETWLSDPYTMLKILPEVKPTYLFSVPAYWEKLYALAVNHSDVAEEQYARLHQITGGKLRFLLSGGAGLKRQVKEFFKDAGLQMIEGYGMTECSPNLTMNRLDDYDFDSVGKPVPGVTLKLADDGEIIVKGDNVFLGYYKNKEATDACYDDGGWFHTGDLGAWRPGGFLQIKGRKKEIIATSGGKKIGPAGIEALYAGKPFVEYIVLYGNERKYLTALVTLDEAQLERYCRDNAVPGDTHAERCAAEQVGALVQGIVDEVNAGLAPYETVKKCFIFGGHLTVDGGHLTPSLKLRRAAVWKTFEAELDALY